MKNFLDLFEQLDQTKSTKEKALLIAAYFSAASSRDAAWALFFLSGHKLKRVIGSSKLFAWCIEVLALSPWLAEEAYAAVGDTAETVALLIGDRNKHKEQGNTSLADWLELIILPLQKLSSDEQKAKITQFWQELDRRSIFMLNKILTGSLRVGVSQLITLEGLSQALQISRESLSQKLMGNWSPSAQFYESLKTEVDVSSNTHLNPYPFYLASPLEGDLATLGPSEDWIAEWKWDGIRAQGIKRGDQVAIWSRGNELISHTFPELVESFSKLENGTVLDGEILAYSDHKPLPFGELQKRLNRKKTTPALLKSVPIGFMIYDLLEYQGKDVRQVPLVERQFLLQNWAKGDPRLHISPQIQFLDWSELYNKRIEALENGTEGLMLKKKDSVYGMGRKKGNWWKYKVDPKTIDAVLLYAQPGSGWRANLYTDYTFGVWHEGQLIPITKAYSGLSYEEILKLDRWIRKNTEEKFGPVRKVKAEHVFEIAFEGIQASPRHKSGVALRFPRMLRWRSDKGINDADILEKIKTEFQLE